MLLLPTVSESGWVRDPVSIFDRLLSYMIVSDYSQTNLYRGNITSIPKILQQHQGNITDMTIALGDNIGRYLGRYYKTASAEALDITEDINDSKVTLSLYVKVTDYYNQSHVLSRMIEKQNGIVKKIININNG